MAFINELKNIKKRKVLISIYHNQDDVTKFSVGYIVFIDDKYFILKHIDQFGNDDGYILRKSKDVLRIDYNDSYTKRVGKLYKLKGNSYLPIFQNDSQILSIIDFLEIIKIDKLISTYFIDEESEDGITGYIKQFQGDILEISILNEDGEYDGNSKITIESICAINCMGDCEQSLFYLSNSKG